MVKTYTRAQIEQLLTDVVPYDWHAFFERSVYQIAVHPPTDEIARAGWKLAYTSAPNEFIATSDALRKSVDAWYSIGLRLSEKGKVQDVRPESAAWKAGLAPGMTVTAIDGQAFDKEVVPYAIQVAQHSSEPIVFLAENNGWFSNYDIVYHDGPKFPHLVRVPGTPNLFGDIMAAHGK
jgi:predicted metalloprotease with PDZ domain